jgi:hypothetical protein
MNRAKFEAECAESEYMKSSKDMGGVNLGTLGVGVSKVDRGSLSPSLSLSLKKDQAVLKEWGESFKVCMYVYI